MKSLAAALALLCAATATASDRFDRWDVDVCRIDKLTPPAAERAAIDAWEALAKAPSEQRKIVINPTTIDANTIPVFFIKDSLPTKDACKAVIPGRGNGRLRDFDAQTVMGVCQARGSAVVCSSDTVRALFAEEKNVEKQLRKPVRNGVSPSLVYVFGHELAHIVLGHSGAFMEGVTSINLSAPRDERIARLVDSCHVDPQQLERERAADARAFDALKVLSARAEYASAGSSIADSLISNSDIIFFTSQSLTSWGSEYYGAPRTLFPSTAALCRIVTGHGGTVVLPVHGGSHPHAWSRMATIAETVTEFERQSRIPPRDPCEPTPDSLLGINRFTDELFAKAYEASAQRFCDRVLAIENGSLDCTAAGLPEDDDGFGDTGNEIVAGLLGAASRKDEDKTFPIDFTPSPARPLAAADSAIMAFEIGSSYANEGEPCAAKAAEFLQKAYGNYLRAVDKVIREQGGSWIHEEHHPVTSGYNGIDHEYLSQTQATVAALVPQSFKPKEIPEYADLARYSGLRVEEMNAVPWAKASAEVWMWFWKREDTSAYYVRTEPFPLDQIFDPAAPNGGVVAPAPALIDLVASLRTALAKKHGGTFVLHDLRLAILWPANRYGMPEPWRATFDAAGPGTMSRWKIIPKLQEIERIEQPKPAAATARPKDVQLPLDFTPSAPGPDVADSDAAVLYYDASSYLEGETEAVAQANGPKMRDAYAALLQQIDAAVQKDGGHWVVEHHQPVRSGYNSFGGVFLTHTEAKGLARVSRKVTPKSLSALRQLHRWGTGAELWVAPWSAFRGKVYFALAPEDGAGDWYLFATTEMPIDDILAPSGTISAEVADIIRTAAARLQKRFGRPFVPRKSDEPALYAVFDAAGADAKHARADAPPSWYASIAGPPSDSSKETELLAKIDHVLVKDEAPSRTLDDILK